MLAEGEDAVVFAYGPVLLAQAWHAVEQLRARDGVRARLIDLPWLNRLDAAWLAEQVRGTRAVVTIDNHFLAGGQGEMIGCAMAELDAAAPPLLRLGVETIPACGRNDEVLRHHGLDAHSLRARIAAFVQKG